ncbi:DNA recombination and repair protein Rad51-like, C-terminal [Dillenia turbinata]|uniref:DNA recombination and repair protein Rad51-like, C-terminal n=1 Tax=Dillenia turbinata TaxID=194707 RepID=A0AAN8VW69_9MAGN
MHPQNLLLLSPQKCTLGCPILDRSLAGGIPCKSITEIVAESGSGKTQLCLQLLLTAQLPTPLGGLSASSFYIHTEFPVPLRRLRQLAHSFKSSYSNVFASSSSSSSSSSSTSSSDPCDFIFVRPVHTADQLFDLLLKLDSLLENPPTELPVKLIVIDSIAALFRSEFENNPGDLKRRSSLFFKIAGKLKSQAERFGLAVVITNQVVDVMTSSEGINGLKIGNLGNLYSSGRRVYPSLGPSWAHCVNSRLFLSRDEEILGDHVGSGEYVCRQTRRQLHVLFAPHLPICVEESLRLSFASVFSSEDRNNLRKCTKSVCLVASKMKVWRASRISLVVVIANQLQMLGYGSMENDLQQENLDLCQRGKFWFHFLPGDTNRRG